MKPTLVIALSLALVTACSDDDATPVDGGPDGPAVEAGTDSGGADTSSDASQPVGSWLRFYDVSSVEGVEAVARGTHGALLAGEIAPLSRDLFVASVDDQGTLSWYKSIGASGWDQANAVLEHDGKIWVAGRVSRTDTDLWLVSFDLQGNILSQQLLDVGESDIASALAPASDGIWIAGSVEVDTTSDFWVIRLASDGQLLWQKRYGQGDLDLEDASAIVADPNGGAYVVGTTVNFNESNLQGWAVALDDVGAIRWQKAVGGAELDRFDAAVALADGVIAVGSTKSSGAGGADGWAVRFGSDGAVAWQKTYGGTADDWAAAATAVDDELVFAGRSESFDGADDSQFWVTRIDASGALIWSRSLGVGGDYDSAHGVAALDDGSVVVGGFTEEDDGSSDWLVARLDASGDIAGECSSISVATPQSADATLATTDTVATATDTTGGLATGSTGSLNVEMTGYDICP